MQKEEMKKIIARLFSEYGFTVQGKYYYLDLNEVALIAVVLPRFGQYVLSYNFSLKSVPHKEERIKGDPFTAYDSRLVDTCNVTGKKGLNPESLSVDGLEKDIKERLCRYFDPFKKNPLDHILSNTPMVRGNAPDIFVLKIEVKMYLKTVYNIDIE